MPTSKASKVGRPSKYTNDMPDKLLAFFSIPKNRQYLKSEKVTRKSNGTEEKWREYGWIAEELPTFAGFARKVGVNGDTVVEWTKKHSEFSAAYKAAKELQKEFLVDNALKGLTPATAFIFTAKNITDMRDRTELTGADGGPVQIQGVEISIRK